MIRAAIVDDESNGREVLKHLLKKHFPNMEVVGLAHSVESGLNMISEAKPDLLFLDVEMPNESGFDLLRKFERIPFDVIFVTAHEHYAIKAIKFSAMDYILKPIDVDDLRAAIQKYEQRRSEGVKQGALNIHSDTGTEYEGSLHTHEEIPVGRFIFNTVFRELKCNGEVTRLSKKEALLLKLLYLHQDKYLTRENALKAIWTNNTFYNSRSMDVYIARLRKLFKDDPSVQILNIYGDGFRLVITV